MPEGNSSSAFDAALRLLAGGDREFLAIVFLSLEISIAATFVSFAAGAPAGAALAAFPIKGQRALLVLANGLLGLPSVVVGLVLYVLLSRSGPLGGLGLLFTPPAMIAAQTLLTLPIVIALAHRACAQVWHEHADMMRMDGLSAARSLRLLMRMSRSGLLTAFLTAFGRAISEVGAIMIVGGNIRGVTRTMTTAIMLETSKGDLALALAMGAVLIALSLLVSALAFLAADREPGQRGRE